MYRILFAFCFVLWSGLLHAQDWPAKPVRIVVPFSAGGATDIPARLLGDRLSKLWGQPVVVENKPGAGGALAAAEVAKAPADGYTLLFPSGSVMTVNQFVYAKLPYDPEKDFTPVMNVVSSPQVLVVNANSPYTSMEALIEAARKEPRKLTYGHAGVGSQTHLANEFFLKQANISAVAVPYKGDPLAVKDIIGGSIDYSVISLGASLANIKAGKLRALGVTSATEIPQLPGVRPIGAVVPNFENAGWFGLVAPTGVPKAVIDKIYRDASTALQAPDLRERLQTLGFTIVGNSPEVMANAMNAERKRWAVLVKERHIRSQ